MTYNEFLNRLRIHLAKIPKDEQDRIVEYYSEIINDKIDEGKTEEQAIAELGTPEQVAQSVLGDYPDTALYPKKKKRNVGAIVGFSILIPFVILMVAVLIVIALSFIVSSASLIIAGVTYFISSFIILPQNLAAGLFQLGLSCFTIALGIFALFGSIAFAKLCFRITKKTVRKYISVYGGV